LLQILNKQQKQKFQLVLSAEEIRDSALFVGSIGGADFLCFAMLFSKDGV